MLGLQALYKSMQTGQSVSNAEREREDQVYHLSLLNVDNKEDDSRLVEFPNVQAIINKKKKKKKQTKASR